MFSVFISSNENCLVHFCKSFMNQKRELENKNSIFSYPNYSRRPCLFYKIKRVKQQLQIIIIPFFKVNHLYKAAC